MGGPGGADDYERFGTTRTLENMPVFGGQPTMEGLLIESSINAPFHFINQAETSETQTQAVPGIDYPDQMDFPTGLAHLRLYGVRYYVAYDACKDPQEKWVPCAELGQQDKELQAATAAGLPVVKRSGRFTIFEVGTGNLVEVPRFRPVLVDHPDWRANGLTWYANPDWLETPLVFASSDDRAASGGLRPARARCRSPACPGSGWSGRASWPPPPAGPATWSASGPTGSASPTSSRSPGSPTGRWRGREGPWLLSPGLMVVVPTQAEVRLSYGDTPVELAGKALTVAGVGALLAPTVLGRVRARRRKGS